MSGIFHALRLSSQKVFLRTPDTQFIQTFYHLGDLYTTCNNIKSATLIL